MATSTLAWGVNTPAHLVVIKGTEYYDAPSKRYVDFPITDVLQVCATGTSWQGVPAIRVELLPCCQLTQAASDVLVTGWMGWVHGMRASLDVHVCVSCSGQHLPQSGACQLWLCGMARLCVWPCFPYSFS